MSTMQIRPFDWQDQPDVIRIWEACGLVRPENDPKLDIARKMTVHPELFLIGEVAGDNNDGDANATGSGNPTIVATCMATYEGRRGWVDYMAVHPDHQRHGYGRQILAEAEVRLQALGCPKINLRVREGNKQIIAFYEAHGYMNDRVVSLGKRFG